MIAQVSELYKRDFTHHFIYSIFICEFSDGFPAFVDELVGHKTHDNTRIGIPISAVVVVWIGDTVSDLKRF